MKTIYQCDRDDRVSAPENATNRNCSTTYKCINTRKCYWLCRGCLKGHDRCFPQCPDYLSVAKAKRLTKD